MLGCSARGWGGQLQLAGIPWLLSQQVPATLTTLCPAAGKSTPKDSKVESLLRGWEVGWGSRKDPGGLGGERRSHWRPALHLARAPLGQGPRESLISSR